MTDVFIDIKGDLKLVIDLRTWGDRHINADRNSKTLTER